MKTRSFLFVFNLNSDSAKVFLSIKVVRTIDKNDRSIQVVRFNFLFASSRGDRRARSLEDASFGRERRRRRRRRAKVWLSSFYVDARTFDSSSSSSHRAASRRARGRVVFDCATDGWVLERTKEGRNERTVSAEGGISPTDASRGLGEQTWERTIGFGTMRCVDDGRERARSERLEKGRRGGARPSEETAASRTTRVLSSAAE